MQIQEDGSENLAYFVVKFASDVLTLCLLGFDHAVGIRLQCLLRLFAVTNVADGSLYPNDHAILGNQTAADLDRNVAAVFANSFGLVSRFNWRIQLAAEVFARILQVTWTDKT